MAKKFLQVKNFEKFQHYKDRNPPWIKLYNELLDDYEFSCLQDASKLHLLMIWLLASRTNNKIVADERWIANKINATEKVNLDDLVKSGFVEIIYENQELRLMGQDDSAMLAGCKQSACLETETETETEGEGEKKKKPKRFTKPTLKEIAFFVKENNYNVDSERFINYYDSNGWMVGKNKMKDWQATIRSWNSKNKQDNPNKPLVGDFPNV